MRGSAFCDEVRSLPRLPDREEAIFDAVSRGFTVAWGWHEVVVDGRRVSVAGDYLAIGEPDDFVRMPVGAPLALRICGLLGYRCPTEREVVAAHRAADVRLPARPWGARPTPGKDGRPLPGDPYGAIMLSVERVEAHHLAVELDRAGRVGLVAGHQKDVLGIRKAREGDYLVRHGGAVVGVTDVLAFAGWFPSDGDAEIQHDDGAHEPSYADYSHGLRFVIDEGG